MTDPVSASLPPMPGSRRAAKARARTVVVTGAAGGTGTTTVAALLADAIGGRLGVVVQATDHSTGDLASRLPALEQATSRVTVHDLGAHPSAAATLAASPESSVVLVGSATAAGVLVVRAALDALTGSPDPGLVGRTVVVLVDSARRPAQSDTAPLRDAGAPIVVIRRDAALARPGRIVTARLPRATTDAVAQLLGMLGW